MTPPSADDTGVDGHGGGGGGAVRRDPTRRLVLHGHVTHGLVRWGFHVRSRYFRLLERRREEGRVGIKTKVF